MFVEKQKVLYDAQYALNRPEQPWYVAIEGDAIVARWKWMDAVFFAPHEVDDKVKAYTFTVTLDKKGKYHELDQIEQKTKNVSVSGGTISFGGSMNKFAGKATQKSFEFGVGKDRQADQIGLIGFKFDTSLVKQPIREFLAANGWKKA